MLFGMSGRFCGFKMHNHAAILLMAKKRGTQCGTPENTNFQTHMAACPRGIGNNRSVIHKHGRNGVSLFCITLHITVAHH